MKTHLLLEAAEAVLASMREKGLIDESRTGGYMTVLFPGDRFLPPPLLVAQIGEPADPEKIEKYFSFSQEKAQRLITNANVAGQLSSWQSRDPQKNKWGGAIRAGDYILSFSGLPELADEALMLAVAVSLKMLIPEQADWIADISDNDFYRRLIEN